MQPKGLMGIIKEGSDEDRMYDGLASDLIQCRGFLQNLENTRNPYKTDILEDLEREYGLKAEEGLSESERRQQLGALVYARKSNGDKDALEEALHKAGFTDAHVYDNSPAVNPGGLKDEYIVNGDIYDQRVDYTWTCTTYADQAHCTTYADQAHCGTIQDVFTEVIYADPTVNTNMVFFIAKDVTRDGTGAITGLTKLNIPINLRLAFRRIVLRLKPTGTWGALAVNWTGAVNRWGFGYFPFGNSPFGL